VPSTPSDVRAHLNTRTEIRRILRNDGMITEQPLTSPPAATAAKSPSRIDLLESRMRAVELALEKLITPK
jgi:hypothetical protein